MEKLFTLPHSPFVANFIWTAAFKRKRKGWGGGLTPDYVYLASIRTRLEHPQDFTWLLVLIVTGSRDRGVSGARRSEHSPSGPAPSLCVPKVKAVCS